MISIPVRAIRIFIIAKIRMIFSQRFPHISNPPKDDICYATQNRQEAVSVLSTDADVVLVLGSQNSSNSQRLREIAEEKGIQAYLIDDATKIESSWFEDAEVVLVTAGASAPEEVVQECLQWLHTHCGAIVEEESIREERVLFPLPKALRGLQASATSEVSETAD